MNTKIELQTQLNNIQAQIDSLNDEWKVPGGEWYLNNSNIAKQSQSDDKTRKAGREFKTQKDAAKASIHHTNFSIMYQLALELNGDWVPDWNDSTQRKFSIVYDYEGKIYDKYSLCYSSFFIPAFSKEAVEKALKILNNQELMRL